MPTKPLIGLMISVRDSHSRGLITGILNYIHEHDLDWHVHLPAPNIPDEPLDDLNTWAGRGIIAQVNSRELAARLLAWGRPVVNVSGVFRDAPFPHVNSHNLAIGRLAADHLLERGLRHFACVAMGRQAFARERTVGFLRHLRDNGYHARTTHLLGDALATWLRARPKPLGVFAVNDNRARHVADACLVAGLRVPEDVAIIGVDNDEFLCNMGGVPLSSVAQAAQNAGYVAAELLADLIAGTPPPTRPILIEPLGVIRRRSSDMLAVDDPDITAALRFIQQHAAEPISVMSILHAVPVSRRWLERRFREVLHRTPLEEIRRVRIEKAKSLLAQSDLPMSHIAQRCGFANQKVLAMIFRRAVGQTPTDYRRGFRRISSPPTGH